MEMPSGAVLPSFWMLAVFYELCVDTRWFVGRLAGRPAIDYLSIANEVNSDIGDKSY